MSGKTPASEPASRFRLDAGDLQWCCDESWLPFRTTESVDPIRGVVGQEGAMEALRFGLETDAPGQNIFVRGLTGTGRMSLLKQLMEDIRPAAPAAPDRIYVHNFDRPERPRLLSLPRGTGRRFRALVEELCAFIDEELSAALDSEATRDRRSDLDEQLQEEIRRLGEPFEEKLRANGLALVPVQTGQTMQPAIMPLVDGQPVPPDRFRELRRAGTVDEATAEAIRKKIEAFSKQFQAVSGKVIELQSNHRDRVAALYRNQARALLLDRVKRIRTEFPQEEVRHFLNAVVEDLTGNRLRGLAEDTSFTRLYRVNLLSCHDTGETSPFVIENAPALSNLVGNIERRDTPGAPPRSDHLMIAGGALLQADGGYLILEARDLLGEPEAYRALIRTLRTGMLEIAAAEPSLFAAGIHLKPDPIPIRVKVVLLGDPGLYYLLDARDPDFPHLFKVLADFDTSIARDATGVFYYAQILAKLAAEENLLPFTRGAVAVLCEYGARIAARRNRLTTRFGRLADIAREAAHLAGNRNAPATDREHVRDAVRRIRRRADLPARRYRKLVSEGTIRIQTRGVAVGQVNGLAVIHAGPLTYGFPTRITATVGPGTGGAINIEREADLSGAIHTKGFYILGGLLRHLLRPRHPFAFAASVAFEQSYGGIDGDSASGAEICCLLSALTGVPLRQDLAMTGAIDQLGNVEPIGAVTEKVEGFYDTCRDLALTGTQGVIIPRTNAGDLMLRPQVVEACAAGRFRVYAVDTIRDALHLFTGMEPGIPDEQGRYPSGTFLGLATKKITSYWNMAAGGASVDPASGEHGPEGA